MGSTERRLVMLAFPVPMLLAGLSAMWIFTPRADSRPDAAPVAAVMPSPAGILVDVSGAVVHPGMYRLHRGDRAYAAIAAAGGTTAEADPSHPPDVAALLHDGQQIRVPSQQASGTGARLGKVSLNTAGTDELAVVPGFDPGLAAAVIDYRNAYGDFSSLRDLVTVMGMSDADYQLARRHLTL
jgi:competence protein ComEA